MRDWEVDRPTGVCAVAGRPLLEGEEYYAVLFEEGEGFRRADYSLSAWNGPPPGCFCYFKSRVPKKEHKRRLLIDDDALLTFFVRLAEETDPARVRFRFVLALVLMRKRLLKYESSRMRDGIETWTLRLVRDHTCHTVVNPGLTDDRIAEVSRDLTAILHGDTASMLDDIDDPGSEDRA